MKALLTLLLLLAVSAGVFVLGTRPREDNDRPLLHVAEQAPLNVRVAGPQRQEVVRRVQAPGDVEAVLEVEVSSEVVARIERMPVEEGDRVAAGDLLCRLDDDNLLAEVESGQARVARIQAAVRMAEADFEKAERDMQRQIRLSEQDATSVLEMAEYRSALKRAVASLDMRRQELVEAEALLKRLSEDLKRTVIEAPIDGVVSKLNAKQGEVVVTGTMNNPGTVIMTVSDLSRMQVRARVDEIDVPLVRPQQPALIYLQSDPDRPVSGKVVRVASKGTKMVGRDVVTFETILEVLEPDERIKPGMTANVEIEVARHPDALTIPVEAVVHRLRKELADTIVAEFDRRQVALDLSERARQAQYIKVVYVMEGDVARLRLIDTGIADHKRVESLQGVELSDQVITGPYHSLDQLKDGHKVALIKDEDKEGQAADDDDDDEARAADSQTPEPADDTEGT